MNRAGCLAAATDLPCVVTAAADFCSRTHLRPDGAESSPPTPQHTRVPDNSKPDGPSSVQPQLVTPANT